MFLVACTCQAYATILLPVAVLQLPLRLAEVVIVHGQRPQQRRRPHARELLGQLGQPRGPLVRVSILNLVPYRKLNLP